MRLIQLSLAALTLSAASHASSQQASADGRTLTARPQFIVKTVALHRLTSKEAVNLLSPYSQTPGGGVYELSPNVRAVTIREVPRIFNEMMTVLAQYDREPATVTLNFQLVSAENTNTRDPAVAPLDSLLRGVLKFTGYRLLGTAVANASENMSISQKLSADGESLTLQAAVTDLRIDGKDASVHIGVDLSRDLIAGKSQRVDLLSTGVTVPIGQTVVLGTSTIDAGQRALILTVRPLLAKR
jgi:hypothetical protein